ncbi:hypothetical protein ACKLNR_002390 [Fusarium oxysporum f. sp. zingiberi]
MQSDVLSFRDTVSRLHVPQRVSGLNVRFLHQQRHTPAVLFTRVTLFLPIADCIIAFQANATKGSELRSRLLEAQVNHHNLDYSTAGDENWYLTELLVTHFCVSLAVPSNFTNCPSFGLQLQTNGLFHLKSNFTLVLAASTSTSCCGPILA